MHVTVSTRRTWAASDFKERISPRFYIYLSLASTMFAAQSMFYHRLVSAHFQISSQATLLYSHVIFAMNRYCSSERWGRCLRLGFGVDSIVINLIDAGTAFSKSCRICNGETSHAIYCFSWSKPDFFFMLNLKYSVLFLSFLQLDWIVAKIPARATTKPFRLG